MLGLGNLLLVECYQNQLVDIASGISHSSKLLGLGTSCNDDI